MQNHVREFDLSTKSRRQARQKTIVGHVPIKMVSGTRHGGNQNLPDCRVCQTSVFYQQQRSEFSYFYSKRRVLADGRNTVPLDIELCPAREEEEPMQGDEEEEKMEWNDQDQENVNTLVSLMEED